MKLDPVPTRRKFHFIGICGTAMGSVAAGVRALGHGVTGSDDKVYPPMSTFLEEQGIEIREGYRPENLAGDADIIVVGNAISRGNPEIEEVLDRKLHYVSLPELMKELFLRGRRNLVVTGTHGKTTTSSLLAWMLDASGRDPSFMIGGLPRNLGKGARFTGSPFVVLEGDEYDTAFFDKRSKFVHYLPEAVVINNIEFDHADIFPDLDAIKLSFERMLRLVPRNGAVFVNGDDANCLDVASRSPVAVSTVGFADSCTHRIMEVEYDGDESRFVLDGERYVVRLPGEYNVRNAAMAVCAARFAGLDAGEVRAALAGFEGVARRMELRGERRGVRVVDDFGHHPSAIRQAVDAARQKFPGGRIWAVFEPRSNTSRRRVFQHDFAAALARADGVFVAAVPNPEKVPAGEMLDTTELVDELQSGGTEAYVEPGADAIVERLSSLVREGDTIVVFSNGGFDGIHGKLLNRL